MRNLEEFNNKHAGEKCFIIGAGTSIHGQDLEPLKNHVIIAVNSGYVAVPNANYFISDDWSIKHWSYFFRDLVNSKTTTALLYEKMLIEQASWFGSRTVLFRHQQGIRIPDRYIHKNKKSYLGETRTSLGSAIMAAHIMGCSEIIILGLDGCRVDGFRYFWQFSGYEVPYRNDDIPIDKYDKCRFRGQITDFDLLDMRTTWRPFGLAVNKKCKIYNASPISIVDIFPKVKFSDVV